jgi:tRNA-dihydrouridine synthase
MKLNFAPIRGVTLAHYRDLHSKIFGGIDKYYAPFIVTTEPRQAGRILFEDIEPSLNTCFEQVVPQLLSNNSHDFNYYASKIQAMGYSEINWNIGCPFPTVTNKRRGSGLLEDPDFIKKFLKQIDYTADYQFTVKMRLGFNELEEGIEVMERLNLFPIENVIIHARTGIQKYGGQVDLQGFDTLYKLCQHKVTYNGDIYTLKDFDHIRRTFPNISSFMIGRGLLRNPFLANQLRGKSVSFSTAKEQIWTFHDEMFNHYKTRIPDEQYRIGKMKDFWTYLSDLVDPEREFTNQIRRTQTEKDYTMLVDKMLSQAQLRL